MSGHLLELVEDEHHAAAAVGRELRRQLEQALERLVQVLGATRRAERERRRSVERVDRHDRDDAEAGEDPKAVPRPDERRGDVVVDRPREPRGELLLRRGLHQVDLGDQDVLGHQLLRDPPQERGLAVAARGDERDVLAVLEVAAELAHLVLAVGERLVEREVAEREGVRHGRSVTQVRVVVYAT